MSGTDTAEVLARTVGGLAVVLGLLWAVARVARSRLAGGPRRHAVQLVHRVQVGRRASLTVVRIADRSLLLGVGDAGVTLIADLPDPPDGDTGGPAAGTGDEAGTGTRVGPGDDAGARAEGVAAGPARTAVPLQRPRPVGLRGAIARAQDRTVRR